MFGRLNWTISQSSPCPCFLLPWRAHFEITHFSGDKVGENCCAPIWKFLWALLTILNKGKEWWEVFWLVFVRFSWHVLSLVLFLCFCLSCIMCLSLYLFMNVAFPMQLPGQCQDGASYPLQWHIPTGEPPLCSRFPSTGKGVWNHQKFSLVFLSHNNCNILLACMYLPSPFLQPVTSLCPHPCRTKQCSHSSLFMSCNFWSVIII